jgi:hypothetical protein
MKVVEAVKALFKRTIMSEKEIQAAIDRSMDYQWRTRLPEAPGTLDNYISFLGRYSIQHPDAPAIEAHEAAMKSHPEWWSKTLLQKSNEYQSVYSH